MKRCFYVLIALTLLLPLCGCWDMNTLRPYISKGREYTISCPKGWSTLNDPEKIAKESTATGTVLDNFSHTDVFMHGMKKVGCKVLILDTDAFMKQNMSAGATVKADQFLDLFQMSLASSGNKSRYISVSGRRFLRIDMADIGKNSGFIAMTENKGKIYAFGFMASKKIYEKETTLFEQCLASISFNESDIIKAEKRRFDDRDGFLTGLLHGLLVMFRFIGSFFLDIKMLSDNHTGTFYYVGYVLGLLLIGGGGSKARS